MYSVFLQPPTKRFLKKVPQNIRERIIKKLEKLKRNPSLGSPLAGRLSSLWKLRVGDYRVIYQIIKDKIVVVVLRIGHRKNVYG